MADYKVTDTELTSIANAIRAKTGKEAQIEFPTEFVSEIGSISGGGMDDPFALTDYIESNGSQWIDTGYTVSDNALIEIVANVLQVQATSPVLAGVRNQDTSRPFQISFSRTNSNITMMFGQFIGDANIITSYAARYINYKTMYSIKYGGGKVERNDFTADGKPFTSLSASQFPLFLFTLNQGGTELGESTRCIARLYRMRIFENGILVHNFLPWTDSNDVVCLKDTVTGNLKYNQGTGVFVRGTDS